MSYYITNDNKFIDCYRLFHNWNAAIREIDVASNNISCNSQSKEINSYN